MAGNGEVENGVQSQRLQHCAVDLFSHSRGDEHKSKSKSKSSPSVLISPELDASDGCGQSEVNSDCFQPQSFRTLVYPKYQLVDQKVVADSFDNETLHVSHQPNSEPLAQVVMLPTLTNTVSNKLEGNAKDQQFVIVKVMISSGSPLRNLLVSDTNTVVIHKEGSPIDHDPAREMRKVQSNSRTPTKRQLMHDRRKDEKNTKQRRKPSWMMPFVCCSASFICCSTVTVTVS